MTVIYVVEQGEVRMVERTIMHTATVEDFSRLLATPRDNNIMHLPANTRHILAEGATGRIALVIELPPAVRTMTWGGGARAGKKANASYTLAVPWVYFVFGLQRADPDDINSRLDMANWGVFCARKRLMALTDPLKALPINNVYTDGRICFGSAAAEPGQNIGQHIDNLVTNFWNTDFNYDVWPHLPGFTDYEEWQKVSATDPTCWLKWPWDDPTRWDYPNMTIEGIAGVVADRITPIVPADLIPELPTGATFGRTEQWLATLTDAQRDRLRVGLGQ
jgi:hypothetical protein